MKGIRNTMPVLKCKMCGGTLNISDNQTICECEYCGTKQTLPKLDNERLLNMYDRASWLRRNNDFDKASIIYEQILSEDKSDAEAYWSLVLCKYGVEYVEDPSTGNRIPTVNRTQLESIFNDVNYKEALNHATIDQKLIYEAEAKRIDEIQKGILSISRNEEPYDIFICYKETDEKGNRTIDSVLAQDIYSQLSKEGYKVFFSRITLEDKIGEAYEPYIFAALNSAKIMIVVGTNRKNLDAVWVKNEWSRYLSMIKKGERKVLIPAYRDMNPYDLPEEFAYLQAQDMSKLGFMQDLIRGINKILDVDSKTKESVSNITQNNSNILSLLKRANMFLEDRDFNSANEYFEKVLDLDPENSEANLGQFYADNNVSNGEEYASNIIKKYVPELIKTKKRYKLNEEEIGIQEIVDKYFIPGYLGKKTIESYCHKEKINCSPNVPVDQLEYEGYVEITEDEREEIVNEINNEISSLDQNKQILKIIKYGNNEVVEKLKSEIKNKLNNANDNIEGKIKQEQNNLNDAKQKYYNILKTAEDKVSQLHDKQIGIRDNDYTKAINEFNEKQTIRSLKKNLKNLESMKGYKESNEYSNKYRTIIHKKSSRKIIVLSVLIVTITISFFALIQAYEKAQISRLYNKAVKYYEESDYRNAAITFGKVSGYLDSYDKAMWCWDKIADRKTLSVSGKENSAMAVAIKNDGSIESSEIALSEWNDVVAVSNTSVRIFGLRSNGTIIFTPNSYIDRNVNEWNNIVSITVNPMYILGLSIDGKVKCSGNEPICASCALWKDIIDVSSSDTHCLGLKLDGTVIAAGSNYYHACDTSNWRNIIAISAGPLFSLGLKSDGTVVGVGTDLSNQLDVSDWTDIVAISAGSYHSLGLKADGTVVAAGSNQWNQCDVSDWTDIVAICAGYNYSVGLKSDGTLVVAAKYLNIQEDISSWTDIKVNN